MTQTQIEELQELKRLFDAGILTEEEMKAQKAKILAQAEVEIETTQNEGYDNSGVDNSNAHTEQPSKDGYGKLHLFIAISVIVIVIVLIFIYASENKELKKYNPQNDLFAEPKTKRLRFATSKSKRNGQNLLQKQKRNGLHFDKHTIQNNT